MLDQATPPAPLLEKLLEKETKIIKAFVSIKRLLSKKLELVFTCVK